LSYIECPIGFQICFGALIVVAIFRAAKIRLTGYGQNGLAGDIKIKFPSREELVTRCELKNGAIEPIDIDRALQKIAAQGKHVQNYIFITTEPVADEVREYARTKYDETGGVEIAILDCVGFLRHFLHLFHRLRKDSLDQYQALVLKEPDIQPGRRFSRFPFEHACAKPNQSSVR
jgi:hypothetical protein